MSDFNGQSDNRGSVTSNHIEQVMPTYMANISHEIRTPATAVIGWSELLLRGKYGALPETQRELVALINQQEKYLLAAFEELVAFYRLASGQLQLQMAEVDLGQLLDRVITSVEDYWFLGSHSVRAGMIRQEIPSTLPSIKVDSSQFERSLSGMLAEMIHRIFNDAEGGIILTVNSDESWFTLDVLVVGQGLGYDYQNLPRVLFCQAVVEMHGGKMYWKQQQESVVEVVLILPVG